MCSLLKKLTTPSSIRVQSPETRSDVILMPGDPGNQDQFLLTAPWTIEILSDIARIMIDTADTIKDISPGACIQSLHPMIVFLTVILSLHSQYCSQVSAPSYIPHHPQDTGSPGNICQKWADFCFFSFHPP